MRSFCRPLLVALPGFLLCSITCGGELRMEPVKPLVFRGSCDASAAEALTDDLVAVADDEDNRLRVYSRSQGGNPIGFTELSGFLGVDPKSREADLEAAARIGERIYWISSHGRNMKGKFRRSRDQFFATISRVTNGTVALEPIGQPYHQLLSDLIQEPRLARFDLWNAAQLPPKAQGALNIEGLAATLDGRLLIGFRNPIPGGQALLVPLLNPEEVITLKRPRFGDPLLVDLGGLGIRSITSCRDRFFIIAGRFDEGGESRLFEWKPDNPKARPLEGINFQGFSPEALTIFDTGQGAQGLFVTSDDGTIKIGGKPCKKLKDPSQKSFRAIFLTGPQVTM